MATGNEQESLVFVEASNISNDDESIELLPENASSSFESNAREDIVAAQKLPKKTKDGLFFSSEEGLEAGKNKVKSRPTIDEKIQEKMERLTSILENENYESLHDVGKQCSDLFQNAISHAKDHATSLSAAKESFEHSLGVFCQACDIVAEKFELSEASTVALGDYKRCERERQEHLRKSDMSEADEKREKGIGYLAKAIEEGRLDVQRVKEKQCQEEAEQLLQKFTDEKNDNEILMNNEITGLSMMSDNCEDDMSKLGNSLKFLDESGMAAKAKFQEIDRELDQKLFENAQEQEELRKKLEDLQRREKKLEGEKETRQGIQQIAEETERRARRELDAWNKQILELYKKCQAALDVMWKFKEGSNNLMETSIKIKIEDSMKLHQLDIMAQRCLRDALAAAAVDRRQHIENCSQNLEFLKAQIKSIKEELKSASMTGLAVVVNDLKQKLQKYKDSYSSFQQTKQESEQKFTDYQNQLCDVDLKLQSLGEAVESFEEIYNRYVEEKDSVWNSEDNLGSLED